MRSSAGSFAPGTMSLYWRKKSTIENSDVPFVASGVTPAPPLVELALGLLGIQRSVVSVVLLLVLLDSAIRTRRLEDMAKSVLGLSRGISAHTPYHFILDGVGWRRSHGSLLLLLLLLLTSLLARDIGSMLRQAGKDLRREEQRSGALEGGGRGVDELEALPTLERDPLQDLGRRAAVGRPRRPSTRTASP